MSKSIAIISAIIVLALGAGVFLATNSSDDDTASNASQTENTPTPAAPQPTATNNAEAVEVASAGTNSIQLYSADALADSTTDKNLLFFHAAWCTVCNSVERNIEAGSIPDDVTIFKIDYDSDIGQELADTYRIPIQYTMVQVDTAGAEITQWVNNYGDGVAEVNNRLISS